MSAPIAFEEDGRGRVTAAVGPDGARLYEGSWSESGLARLAVQLPDRRWLELVPGNESHPVLGLCDALRVVGETTARAFCGRIDWHRPERVPALDRPAALPRGGGGALLNALAAQAMHAGVASLRYRGAYPTPMLFDSLLPSFDVVGDVNAMRATFIEGAEGAAIAGRPMEPAVDFVPRPHVLAWPAERVCVQSRSEVERVWIDGYPFDRDATHGRVLAPGGDGELVARVALGSEVVADLVTLSASGVPLGPVQDLAAASADLDGEALPDAVIEVLAEAIVSDASPLLHSAIRDALRPGTVAWGDPGLALVRPTGDAVIVHGALVAHLPTDPSQLLGVLVGLLAWPVRQLAQRRLSDAAEAITRR